MIKPSLDQFVKEWWVKFHKENPKARESEMYQNGQFDELPYAEYEDKYGE